MDPGSGMLLEDFGQRVDLTRRIREVLANYPEGTTALRELIQNADDAGASRVRLCLDRRSRTAQRRCSRPRWPSGRAPHCSRTTTPCSPTRTLPASPALATAGRVGFNSVYHLTDLPSFVSGKYVVLFDPQGAYLPNVSSANPGKRIDYDTILRQGHAFCFLPLPVRTGLSVHVNGYFEVSSNRRDIWYGADMDRGGKLRSDWNRLLLEDVVAPLFRELLLESRMLLDSTTSYYSLWPTGLYEEPWSILVEHIYKAIYSYPVLHSEIEGGTWISPVDALLHDEGFSRSNDLNEALVLLGMPVVRLPKMIVAMLSKFYKKSMLKIVSPPTVRHLLKDLGKLAKLGKSHRLVLLEYCLLDLDSADIDKCMNGLPLIPLANMQFGIFSESSQGNHYYVCDDMEYELLSGVVGDRVVDRNIPTILLDKLHQLASNSQANITLINGPIFVKLFPRTSVSTDTIIQSARQIDSLVNIDQQKAHSRGKVLLSYLEVHALKCMLPWPSVSSMIAPPKQVRMQEDMWIVSASSRILDGECNSSALSYSLGWSSSPSGSVIAAQLLELGKNNEIVTDQVLRQELALVMPKIYSLLANLIGSDEMDIVKVVLEGCRWIWVGDGFTKADEVVLSGHLHLAPYIRVVPVDLAVFKDLFLELGIKEHLHPVDFASILNRMAIRKASASLNAEELRTTVLLVQHLSEFRFQDQPTQIYLPDSSARLCLSSELVFNDAPWLLDFGHDISGGASNLALSSNKHVHNFVHGNISNDVAERLGVRSLRRLLLAESSDSMNLSLSGVAEAFGQHEDLTTRLKHIVEMYADGPGILFELVQNAEDAKASEVVFLLDKTQYGTSSILSPEMAEWQGPALYCFNDSVFSPQDLYAISRIGQDSKLEKPFAIGRNEAAASRSQIKREQYAPQDVEMLFSSFSEVVSEALLFLCNVKKITLYVKENNQEEMRLVHYVSKHNSPQIAKEPHALNPMLEFIHGNRPSGMDRNQFFSGGHARKLSTASGSTSHFFVPWASVAAYLHSVNVEDTKAPSEEAELNHDNLVFKNLELGSFRDRKKFEGRAFCFLPLPINTSIPVHVNAYFELSSNRRDIWIGNDMAGGGRIRSEWNLALLEDVVAPAYGHLLAAIAEELGPSDLFLSFWPSAVGIEPWSSMVRKFYVSIAELGLNVLHTKARGGHWVSTRQAIFPDFSFSKASDLAEVLSQAGLPNSICLPLLPLANGSFATFNRRGEGERVFFTSQIEFDLLKDSVPHLVIDNSLPDGILKKLYDIACSARLNMYLFTCNFLLELLPRILPPEWQLANQLSWFPEQQDGKTVQLGNASNVIRDGGWSENMLYDPRVPELHKVLHKETFFPSEKFMNSDVIELLAGFGLKRNLGFSTLLDMARSVSLVHNSGHDDGFAHGQKLLTYLNFLEFKTSNMEDRETFHKDENPEATEFGESLEAENNKEGCGLSDQTSISLFSNFEYDIPEDRFWSELKNISWCPVHVTPLLKGIPWFISEDNVAPPVITRPKSQMWLVSSKMRILSADSCSMYVQRKLGWCDPPNVNILSSQLVELSKSYDELKMFSADADVDAILQKEVQIIYSRLQDVIGTIDTSILKENLDGHPWVYVGDSQTPDVLLNSLVVPDSFGVLAPARNLVYNDAPWMNADSTSQNFVHLSIGNDLAKRLGVRSLRGSSLLDDELMRDLPCMEYAKISEFLALYGDIQGSSLTVVFEGTVMSREEVCSLQLSPPWKLRGNILNYGLGLLSSYFVCDTLTILSGGYFYIFDPLGLTGGASSTATSSARFFSLIGNDLVERFHDQFIPMRVTQDASLSTANSTVIRMPLSSKCLKELEAGQTRNMALDRRYLAYNLTPIAGVAAHIARNGVSSNIHPSSCNGDDDNLPSASVCSFIKEHYPVFSVPWELVSEIQAVGVTIKEIRPRMVRDLLKASSSISLRSIETYIDVLEYCFSDMDPYRFSELHIPDESRVTGEHVETMYSSRSHSTPSSSSSSSYHSSNQTSGTSGGDALEIMTYFGKALYDFGRGVVEDISKTSGPASHRAQAAEHNVLSSIITELKGVPFPTSTKRLTRLGTAELWIANEEQQLVMNPLLDRFVHYKCLEKPFLALLLSTQVIHRPLKLRSFSPHLLSDKPVLCRVKERHLIFVPPSDDSNTVDMSVDNVAGAPDTLPRDDTGESEQKNTLGQTIVSKLVAAKNVAHLPSPLNLSSEDCDRLFGLFVSEFGLSSNQSYQREELDVLRTLPMYKTVTGTYTSLLGSDHCILSPTAFFQPSDARCLSCSSNANLFLQALGVEQLSDQEILVKFALPGFANKTAQEQENILTYLHANWKDLQLNSAVVETLKETSFVASANEFCTELFKPKELLDPSDALLTSVFSGERNKFPAERYMSDGWLAILRKAGLRTSIEADMIIQCATKIETMGHDIMSSLEDPDDFEADFSDSKNEIPSELWSLAESVVGVIFANFATLYDNSFCEKIGKIAFVPAEKGFPSIGGKRGGRRVLASYNEAILSRDWPLAWSSAPILTKQAIVPPEYSWGTFRLRSPPAFSTVLKHLQIVGRGNGEDTLAHWPTSSGIMTVEDAFLRILQYLNKIWGAMSSSEKLELQKLAFLPVANGTRLVSVKSLFARLTINLSPFAFELPSRYLPFVALLREIGMQESLTNSYARELLLDIQKACGYQRLNPNELRAVMEILDFMCSGVNQNTSDGSEGCYDSHPSIAEWSSNGMHRSICFINKSTGYILVAEPPSFLTIHHVIAIVVSHRLGAPVILPIAALFACPDGSEKEVLKILHLGTDVGVSKREGKYDASLGAELLPQDARQVQFLPLRPFYSGEIVAWKTGKEGEKLRYGRVPEDVRPSAGQALYRFPVETAPGETRMLLSSQVYSFKSVSMADLSSAPFQVDGGRVAGGGQGDLLSINTGTDVTAEMAGGLEYGKVSSTELVQAVHDMLSAAGVRMDAEKETLFQTTLTLQDQLKESQVALLMEQEKAEVAAREADVAKAAWSCRICLNAESGLLPSTRQMSCKMHETAVYSLQVFAKTGRNR
ncbi:hypothetical protein PR202_ga18596 [Eleusine coracana subsp. coracana]|uniref:Sacsin/Nov domain-containing protein n=1 Tax=Eleusine coracana subsp. coracana TaxID=191504 RepID=A0AAV5CS84_ELECO|nr:hypothetical protein PR202_ga18596 [Eleusine coracana subsp. coracana]